MASPAAEDWLGTCRCVNHPLRGHVARKALTKPPRLAFPLPKTHSLPKHTLSHSLTPTHTHSHHHTLTFPAGNPVAIDGVQMSPATLLAKLNQLGGANGIGRVDLVESRFVGMKSRGELCVCVGGGEGEWGECMLWWLLSAAPVLMPDLLLLTLRGAYARERAWPVPADVIWHQLGRANIHAPW